MRRLVAAMALGLSGLMLLSGTPAQAADSSEFQVIAHRGGPLGFDAPENSLRLFELALASDLVDRIETDTRPTADGVPVIMHDSVLPQGCTLAGSKVVELTWEQLQAVRCDGEPVPSLSQVLALILPSDKQLYLELKGWSGATTTQEQTFAKEVAKLVLDSGIPQSRLTFHSAWWRDFGPTLQQVAPGIPLVAREMGSMKLSTKPFRTIKLAAASGADYFAMDQAEATDGMVKEIRTQGMRPMLVAAESPAQIRYAVANGLRTWIADDPAATRAWLDALWASIQVDPLTRTKQVTDVTPKTVLKKTQSARSRQDYQVMGASGLPYTKQNQLTGVKLRITIKAKSAGRISLSPLFGTAETRRKYAAGRTVITVLVSPGDRGKIREFTSTRADVSIKLVGWSKTDY